jgi:hypothetical protein
VAVPRYVVEVRALAGPRLVVLLRKGEFEVLFGAKFLERAI